MLAQGFWVCLAVILKIRGQLEVWMDHHLSPVHARMSARTRTYLLWTGIVQFSLFCGETGGGGIQ